MQQYTTRPSATTPDPRIADMAASLLAAHGASFGDRQWQHVADLDRAAAMRLAYARDLIAAEDRRAARFATAPCCLCGCAFTGERMDLGGEPACAECVHEYAKERGWYALIEFAPLAPAALLRVAA